MAKKTLDLFPTETARFVPAAAVNAEKLYPHAPLLNSVPIATADARIKPVHRRLWLALNFPLLPFAPDIAMSATPAVTVETAGNTKIVLAANIAAQRLEIVRGMRLNSAYALANHLKVFNRDPHEERRALERLAAWSLQYTSYVSVEAPDALLLEVKGSLRLFSGARALRQRMFSQLNEMKIVATTAIAPTSLAAVWLARSAGPYPNIPNLTLLSRYLEKLPLSCLRWPEDICNTLQDLGIRTVGECLRLPRDGFARRMGISLLQELDRAAGRVAQPRSRYVPREIYKARCDFEMEVENTLTLRNLLDPILDDLESFLRSRTAGIQALKIVLRHRELGDTRLILRFVTPIRRKRHVESVLSERLERLNLPAPALSVRVRSGPLQELHSQTLNEKLFGIAGEQAPEGIPRLIEKLRARLGEDAVYGVCQTEDHRPEQAYRKTNLRTTVRGSQPHSLQPTAFKSRPLWLLSQPEALMSNQGAPFLNGPLTLERGPERIQGGWWDSADMNRDYYVMRDRRGVRLWIFCERGKWFLHGKFG